MECSSGAALARRALARDIIGRMSTHDIQQVLEAAARRAAALTAGTRTPCVRLMHPSLRWTTFTGDVMSRDQYIAGNTGDRLRWRSQRLADVDVVVVADTAVLTALVTDDSGAMVDETFTLRLTQAWVRAEGKWQCLAGHAGPEVASRTEQ